MENSLRNSPYEDDDDEVVETSITFSNAEKELSRDGNGANPEASMAASAAHHHNSVGGAKYKLMSPAKLPISRSPCTLTIPPGLSPTSFLESPVLLSNIKAEPSPTTGSFCMSQLMQSSREHTSFSIVRNCSVVDTSNDTKGSSFEFQFHPGPMAASGHLGPMVSSGINQQHSEQPLQVQNEGIYQTFANSSLVKSEMQMLEEFSRPANMNTSSISSTNMNTSSISSTSAVDSDVLNKRDRASMGVQATHSDNKDSPSSITSDRSSDDGYNWRKYGQKLVKGSEFPRSYYKCTYPNCEVKKIFERSPDGQITEIVYKGSHDHPKPQPSRRFNPGALMSIQEEKFDRDSSLTCQEEKPDINAQNSTIEPNSTPVPSPQQENDDGLDVAAAHCANDEIDEEDPFSKRRKFDGVVDITPVVKPIREPRVVVQTISEVDILDDGYRWRKYGQKVVRGNPNPRSYYKCTSAGCPVRKHVERASHDPKAVITTYEGKHNHDVPTARNSSHEMAGAPTMSGISRMMPEDNDPISLDLGVGRSYGAENRTNGQLNMQDPEQSHQSQVPAPAPGKMLVQASPFSACYGVVNGGSMALYGSRENLNQGGSGFDNAHLQPSNQPQNLGRMLLGP